MAMREALDVLRCVTAISVWVFEYLHQDIRESADFGALDKCQSELLLAIKKFKKATKE